ncbi:hypothetical protein ACQPX6_18780 [Actinomycetospora sp. CA-101289]|uniref:hypothetical protein n=1 Tax=Actinomycetospora sp. CA-101289 TaxID=3239893 RepID=UPI003D98C362
MATELVQLRESLDDAEKSDRQKREAFNSLFERERVGIGEALARAERVLNSDQLLYMNYASEITRIENSWNRVEDTHARSNAPTVSLAYALDDCIRAIGVVTVPASVNNRLAKLRVGLELNFHKIFKDELPGKTARVAILEELSRSSEINGIVDVPRGVIVSASENPFRRAWSWVLILIPPVGFLVLAGFTPQWLPLLGINLPPALLGAQGRLWFVGVLTAYAGGLLHVLLAAVRQRRQKSADAGTPFTALGNPSMWVHVHERSLAFYAVAIPIAAYVFTIINGALSGVFLLFVGYSIDSVLDTLVDRFDKIAPEGTKAVNEILAGQRS